MPFSLRVFPKVDRNWLYGLREILSWRRLTGAAGVLIGTTVCINLLRIVNTMILTRLLSPSAYGLVGIIMSIFFVIVMITDTGCYAFVIRDARGLEPRFLDVIWTIHLLRGLASTVVMIALAVPIAHVLDKPALAPLLAVASISLAIDGAASLSLITAARERMVRRLSIIDLAVFLFQMLVGVVAALLLRSVWAIVIATIASSAARNFASYVAFPKAGQRIRFDRTIARDLWRFSRLIAASSTLTLILSQVDRLALARLFSLSQFGVYSVAGGLASAPTAVVQIYTTRIMYPAIAEVWRKTPDQMRQRYREMRGTVVFGYLIAAGGLIGAAPLVVRILYDPRYVQVAPYLRLLAIATAMLMLTKPMNELLMAIGHVRTTLQMNIARLAWLLVMALVGYLALGAIGIVIALALIEVPAYCLGAWRLRRMKIYDPKTELLEFGAIGLGVVAGLSANAIALLVFPIS